MPWWRSCVREDLLSNRSAVIVDLRLDGQRIDLCQVDHAFSFTTEQRTTLRVQTTMTHHGSDGVVTEVNPADDPRRLGPLLGIARTTVADAAADPTGNLTVLFHDDSSTTVAPDDTLEAWALTSRSGFMAVCMPGGELATWEGRERCRTSGG